MHLQGLIFWALVAFFGCCKEMLLATSALAQSSSPAFVALSAQQPSVSSWSASSATARMVGGLFLCLGIFAVIVRFMKRHVSPNSSQPRRIMVRERVALSSKTSLTLVSVDSCEFLVAVGGDSISVVPTRTARSELFAASLDEAAAQEVFNA